MGVQGGQAVGGLVAAADGDRSFVDEGLVVPELLEALQGRGGDRLAALALATTTPGLGGTAGARPHSARAGSLSGGRAAAPRKDGLDSNFRNVVFTMSPMKGAPPRERRFRLLCAGREPDVRDMREAPRADVLIAGVCALATLQAGCWTARRPCPSCPG